MALPQQMRLFGALAAVALLAGCTQSGGPGATPTTATPSTAASTAAPPSGGQAETCGTFDHPIDTLPTAQAGETQEAEGSGCGPGRVPSDGSFTVDAGRTWILRFAYTCDGSFAGMGDPAVVFTVHNTVSGADLSPVIQPGPWGYGAGGLTGDTSSASPPVGTYVLQVSVAHPDLHRCRWHAAVGRM